MIEIFEINTDLTESVLTNYKFDGTKRLKIKLGPTPVLSARMTARQLQINVDYINDNRAWIQDVSMIAGTSVKFGKVSPWTFHDDKRISCSVSNDTAVLFKGPKLENPIMQQIIKLYNPNINKWMDNCRSAKLLQQLFQCVEFDAFKAHFASVKHNSHMFEFFVIDGSILKVEIMKDGVPCDLGDQDLDGALAKTLLFKDLGVR